MKDETKKSGALPETFAAKDHDLIPCDQPRRNMLKVWLAAFVAALFSITPFSDATARSRGGGRKPPKKGPRGRGRGNPNRPDNRNNKNRKPPRRGNRNPCRPGGGGKGPRGRGNGRPRGGGPHNRPRGGPRGKRWR